LRLSRIRRRVGSTMAFRLLLRVGSGFAMG
jgi:hypothetical protein